MNREFLSDLLKVVKETAPEIEAAISGVKGPEVRAAIASAVMGHVLAQIRPRPTGVPAQHGSPSEALSGTGLGGPRGGTQGRILVLCAEDFFAEPRRLEQVLEELRVKGYHHSKSDVRMSLLRLARKSLLRRIPFGTGRQRIFLYTNP